MSAPRTSVVIPAKDRVEELGRAIESVLAQTDADLELIVVDDGSDAPLEQALAGRYADPRLRFVRQANAGPAIARNNGVGVARGEYVAFLDSDDSWEPDKLARQVACFLAVPELALVGTGVRFVHDDGSVPDATRLAQRDAPRVWALLHMTTPSVMLRRSVFLDVGGFSTDLYFMEDKELFLRIGLTRRFETIPDPLTVVHVHGRRTTGQAWKDLSWVERYQRDIRVFGFRVARLMRPGDWRHLAKKVSILEGDVAEMFEQHGQRTRALGAQALSAILSPLELGGYRRLASMTVAALSQGKIRAPGS